MGAPVVGACVGTMVWSVLLLGAGTQLVATAATNDVDGGAEVVGADAALLVCGLQVVRLARLPLRPNFLLGIFPFGNITMPRAPNGLKRLSNAGG